VQNISIQPFKGLPSCSPPPGAFCDRCPCAAGQGVDIAMPWLQASHHPMQKIRQKPQKHKLYQAVKGYLWLAGNNLCYSSPSG